ncbi:MAG TPA: tail fiber domain-containing protein [Tahibacter sp.]|nr:tail fiber domain-containing protein [Tahibacter sp.]
MAMQSTQRRCLVASVVLALSLAGSAAFAVNATLDATGVRLTPSAAAPSYLVRVSGPNGFVFERAFAGNAALAVAPPAGGWADGSYVYEITPQAATSRSRRDADAAAPDAGSTIESGTFRIVGGALYTAEPFAARNDDGTNAAPQPNDQVIPDDLIVQGSACIGLDCVNNESFGFDTIRMKENNTRIKFDDTSATAGFPANDWQLTANDSASGGANKFSIEDITGARVPFTVTAGAPTNSLFMDAFGRMGFGTATPVLKLHMNQSDTPAVRFEQNNSGGFTAQTWDIGANEANFFVRDVTGGSRLSFRIRPGAPTSSLDIASTGNVGVGTASPSVKLHVTNSDGTTQALISETSTTATGRDLLRLENNGPTRMRLKNMATGNEWSINAHDSDLRLTLAGAAVPSMTIFQNGNVTIAGTLTQNSDRNSKENFKPLDHKALLEKIARLDITEWNFKSEAASVRHIGPMAQDFRMVFGLGERDDRIAPLDTSGVALAAVQGLQQEIAVRDARIADLEARLDRLDKMTQRLARAQEASAQALPTAYAPQCAEPQKVAASGL